jgi:hypothetical protein
LTAEAKLDLSNLLSPIVSLDTNVIRSVKENSPPFQLLVELAKAKSVRVVIPEMVIEERRTQWREQQLKNVNDAIKALSALRGEKIISNAISKSLDDTILDLENLDANALSINRYHQFLKDNNFQTRSLTLEESNLAWEGYFSGKPPFKEVKNRADIPDAHILATVQSIAKTAPESYFVAGDKAMLSAAESLDGINAYATIEDLISSTKFVELRDQLEVEKKWKKLKSLVSDIAIQQHVAKFTYEHGDEMLDWKEIRDPSIPEDNHTAVIHSNGSPSDVSVGKVEDWGGGFLRCPVTFSVEANLSFMVYRGDAFDVPDWVSVSFGDLEKDHYFEAEGYREVVVNVDVSIKIDLDQLSSSGEGEVFEIEFEEASAELSLSEDQ